MSSENTPFPNHAKQQMAVSGLSRHQGSKESRQTLEKKVIY